MKHSLPQRISTWIGDRITLVGLWISYPLAAMTAFISGMANRDDFQWIAICFAVIQIILAADASIRVRRRIRLSRGRDRKIDKELLRGSFSLLTPLIIIGAAQHIFRRILAIEYDSQALEVLGYTPGRDAFLHLAMLGGLWVILIAYIGKYRWDYFISLREEAEEEARTSKRQRRRSQHEA